MACTWCLSLLLFIGAEPARDEALGEWPQWRGPHRDARVEGPTWPGSLKDSVFKQRWRFELGPSYSGPIVSKDLVFVTETVNRKDEVIRALDRATGKEIWRVSWPGSMSVPFFARANGDWIRATPAYDGDSIYVAGMRDVLVRLDAKTGQERWRIDFPSRYNTPVPAFGFVCSPLVVGDHVYVQAGGSFVKLDKRTGAEVWRTLEDGGDMFHSAFSSPILTTLAGSTQLLVQTRDVLAGVDPASGRVLWKQSVPAFRGMNILTPLVHGDGVFTSTYQNKSFLYRVSPSQEVSLAWTNKVMGYMSSPVVSNGHVYVHLQNRRVACIDLANGKEKWITRDRFGEYWSMILQGTRILALDSGGKLYLVEANPDSFHLIDSRTVSDEPTWAHLAVAGKDVVVRGLNSATLYRWDQSE